MEHPKSLVEYVADINIIVLGLRQNPKLQADIDTIREYINFMIVHPQNLDMHDRLKMEINILLRKHV